MLRQPQSCLTTWPWKKNIKVSSPRLGSGEIASPGGLQTSKFDTAIWMARQSALSLGYHFWDSRLGEVSLDGAFKQVKRAAVSRSGVDSDFSSRFCLNVQPFRTLRSLPKEDLPFGPP